MGSGTAAAGNGGRFAGVRVWSVYIFPAPFKLAGFTVKSIIFLSNVLKINK